MEIPFSPKKDLALDHIFRCNFLFCIRLHVHICYHAIYISKVWDLSTVVNYHAIYISIVWDLSTVALARHVIRSLNRFHVHVLCGQRQSSVRAPLQCPLSSSFTSLINLRCDGTSSKVSDRLSRLPRPSRRATHTRPGRGRKTSRRHDHARWWAATRSKLSARASANPAALARRSGAERAR
jgi:hypothetical protein